MQLGQQVEYQDSHLRTFHVKQETSRSAARSDEPDNPEYCAYRGAADVRDAIRRGEGRVNMGVRASIEGHPCNTTCEGGGLWGVRRLVLNPRRSRDF